MHSSKETVSGSPLTLPRITTSLFEVLAGPLPAPELGCQLMNPLKGRGGSPDT